MNNKTPVCKSIDGSSIYEGDEVFGFVQKYQTVLTNDIGGIQISEEDHTKPLPIADVPQFRGKVSWNDEMLAYYIQITELIGDWETQPCSIMMGGGHYVYEVINPHPLNNPNHLIP